MQHCLGKPLVALAAPPKERYINSVDTDHIMHCTSVVFRITCGSGHSRVTATRRLRLLTISSMGLIVAPSSFPSTGTVGTVACFLSKRLLVVSLRSLAVKHAARASFVDFCDLYLPASLLEAVFKLISSRHKTPGSRLQAHIAETTQSVRDIKPRKPSSSSYR